MTDEDLEDVIATVAWIIVNARKATELSPTEAVGLASVGLRAVREARLLLVQDKGATQ